MKSKKPFGKCCHFRLSFDTTDTPIWFGVGDGRWGSFWVLDPKATHSFGILVWNVWSSRQICMLCMLMAGLAKTTAAQNPARTILCVVMGCGTIFFSCLRSWRYFPYMCSSKLHAMYCEGKPSWIEQNSSNTSSLGTSFLPHEFHWPEVLLPRPLPKINKRRLAHEPH